MTIDLSAILLSATTCMAVLVIVLLRSAKLRRARGPEQDMHGDIAALRREIEALQDDISALCSGANGVGMHLSKVDRQLMRINERQDQFELRDSIHSEYDQAVRMIQRGASVDEIINQCNLARAEAELLSHLHNPGLAGRNERGIRSVA